MLHMYYIHNNKIDNIYIYIYILNFVKYIKIGFNKTNNKSLNFAIFFTALQTSESVFKEPQ